MKPPPHITGTMGSLVLRERDGITEIMAGSLVLLSSAALETERLFGALAATEGKGPAGRVLVGGLGFGMTVRGALDACPATTRVVVAEKVEGVVELVRGRLAHIAGRPLDDPRVTVTHADVHALISAGAGAWDAILLDVDNGPHWASFRTNARLYAPAGLASARRALTRGGVFAVWSGYRSDGFLAQLRAAGFTPRCVPLFERGRVRARAYVGV